MTVQEETSFMPISSDKKKEIEKYTENLLCQAYGEYKVENIIPPIKLEKIAEFLGVQIVTVNFAETLGNDKGRDIIGLYLSEKTTVYAQKGLEYPRLAFTVAHELGHHCLHKESDILYRFQNFDPSTQNKEKEQEANHFAASLLMPEKLIKSYGKNDPDYIASVFYVSKLAASIRLKNIK